MSEAPYIATSLCAGSRGDRSVYPQLGGLGKQQRSVFLWKCVTVFFASSIRCNPEARHVLFTNVRGAPRVDGVDLARLFVDWGVEVIRLPFTFLPPRSESGSFRNTYYKLDAVKALGAHATDTAVHLDADCLWLRPGKKLCDFIQSDRLTLYDVYRRSDPSAKIVNMSAFDMGTVYRAIDPRFPEAAPIHFGGELIGGRVVRLREFSAQTTELFTHLTAKDAARPPRFANGRTIFDGEEYLSCFVLNRFWRNRWQDAGEYIRRVWDTNVFSNKERADLQKTVLHLPAEKQRGFPLLFREATNPNSRFYGIELEAFAAYLGEYIGIPERKHFYHRHGAAERARELLLAPVRRLKRKLMRRESH